MNSNPEFRDYHDDRLNDRDTDRIEDCVAKQGHVFVAYRRAADDHDRDPEPTPHIDEEHEEMAGRCRIAAVLMHSVGALISFWWSYVGSDHSLFVSLGAILVYAALALTFDLSCSALAGRGSFCRNFWKWFLPMTPVCFAATSILLTERFASPAVATALLPYDTAAWLGLEVSMLMLGAVSMVGSRRFGWSGLLTREYQALEAQIAVLRRKIAARNSARESAASEHKDIHKTTGPAGLAVMLIGLLSAGTAAKGCQSAFADQTGSLDEPDKKEERFSAALAAGVARQPGQPCLTVTPFSANPFSATGTDLIFSAGRPAFFAPMRKAFEAAVETDALTRIRGSLRPRLPVAGCTNISDVMIRAANAPDAALVFSDGKHDCPAAIHRGITSLHSVLVVLVRSRGDVGSDADIFMERRALMLKMMPKAIVFPEFDLEQAVRLLFNPGADPGLVKASF